MKKILVVLVVLVSCSAHGAPAKPPVLTEIQKLQIITAVQRVQLAQLRAKAAQDDLSKCEKEAQDLLKTFTHEGWALDLGRMEYVAQEVKK